MPVVLVVTSQTAPAVRQPVTQQMQQPPPPPLSSADQLLPNSYLPLNNPHAAAMNHTDLDTRPSSQYQEQHYHGGQYRAYAIDRSCFCDSNVLQYQLFPIALRS